MNHSNDNIKNILNEAAFKQVIHCMRILNTQKARLWDDIALLLLLLAEGTWHHEPRSSIIQQMLLKSLFYFIALVVVQYDRREKNLVCAKDTDGERKGEDRRRGKM